MGVRQYSLWIRTLLRGSNKNGKLEAKGEKDEYVTCKSNLDRDAEARKSITWVKNDTKKRQTRVLHLDLVGKVHAVFDFALLVSDLDPPGELADAHDVVPDVALFEDFCRRRVQEERGAFWKGYEKKMS